MYTSIWINRYSVDNSKMKLNTALKRGADIIFRFNEEYMKEIKITFE